jgi:hypothetical protein
LFFQELQGFAKSTSQSKLQFDFKDGEETKSGAAPVVQPEETRAEPVSCAKVSAMAKKFGGTETVQPPFPVATKIVSSSTSTKPSFGAKPSIAPKPATTTDTNPVPVEKKSVLALAKNFEAQADVSRAAKPVDPATLTLSQKLKLFEKAQAEQAKAAAGPPKVVPSIAKQSTGNAGSSRVAQPDVVRPASPQPCPSGAVGSVLAQRMMFEKVEDNWQENDIAKKTFEEKRRDMEVVLSRWQKPDGSSNARAPEEKRE